MIRIFGRPRAPTLDLARGDPGCPMAIRYVFTRADRSAWWVARDRLCGVTDHRAWAGVIVGLPLLALAAWGVPLTAVRAALLAAFGLLLVVVVAHHIRRSSAPERRRVQRLLGGLLGRSFHYRLEDSSLYYVWEGVWLEENMARYYRAALTRRGVLFYESDSVWCWLPFRAVEDRDRLLTDLVRSRLVQVVQA